jgi:hypothetical protein
MSNAKRPRRPLRQTGLRRLVVYCGSRLHRRHVRCGQMPPALRPAATLRFPASLRTGRHIIVPAFAQRNETPGLVAAGDCAHPHAGTGAFNRLHTLRSPFSESPYYSQSCDNGTDHTCSYNSSNLTVCHMIESPDATAPPVGNAFTTSNVRSL